MVVLFDIGGTSVKYALSSLDGVLIERGSFSTEANMGSKRLLKKIDIRTKKYSENYHLDGIGISATGQVDYSSGVVIGATKLIEGWVGTDIKGYFEDRYSVSVVVENDVNCAALGEMWRGAGRDLRDFISIALGTGIGGGIVIDRKLIRGTNSCAGEFGHMKIKEKGALCRCGSYGCYEAHGSTLALLREIEKRVGSRIEGIDIFRYERDGIEPYKEIVAQWISDIGDGLKNIVVAFNPEGIVIGGGVSAQGEYLIGKIRKDLEEKLGDSHLKKLVIRKASLENDAGLFGALYLLREKDNKEEL